MSFYLRFSFEGSKRQVWGKSVEWIREIYRKPYRYATWVNARSEAMAFGSREEAERQRELWAANGAAEHIEIEEVTES